MGRTPCCEKTGLKRGKWTAEEDEKLVNYIKANGEGSWRSLPKNAGLLRCGKSCRLRWINYLREDVKRGNFTADEEETIVKLHNNLGNRWSLIASHLPGRTDNEIKNYWNSHLSRRIYSFRSIAASESTLSQTDIIKMVSKIKKKSGRVSRAVAKKYNIKNPENSPTSLAHKQATVEVGPTGTGERKSASLESSLSDDCCDLLRAEEIWPNAFTLSPKDVREEDTPGPWKEVDGGLLMNVKHFWEEGDVTEQCENILVNDARDEGVLMNTDSGYTHEYACSSPIISYFTDEVVNWDHNLWIEEEQDILIWS
ncbi:hypothetical protein DH2020_020081 [Rehmannia glutinosa]|uniref:R2R3-MYB protein n=1 Tax=Rehmannia glutinosa TaxID=99300 RepID=A0ABR0WFM1_REHGL